jgi:N-methylhydantoinase B
MRKDAHFMSIADRSILACWGVKGGKAGKSFQVTIDPDTPNEHDVDALVDAEFVPAGTVIRVRTTGGGGWGDPLDRDSDLVVRDVLWAKVSRTGAADDYGVVITGPDDEPVADVEATQARRERMRAERPEARPFFDRGPGYAQLSGGAAAPDCDWLVS